MEEEDEEQKPKLNGFGLGLASLQVTELLIDICKKSMKDVLHTWHIKMLKMTHRIAMQWKAVNLETAQNKTDVPYCQILVWKKSSARIYFLGGGSDKK